MNVCLWVLQILLAAVCVRDGRIDQAAALRQAQDEPADRLGRCFSPGTVKATGTL
jgi:hypothetical protein